MNKLISLALAAITLLTSLIQAGENNTSLLCNGYSELCDKRYNEIAQINCHNANSNKFSPVQDQTGSIQDQLNAGIRIFKIPLHYDYEHRIGYYYALLEAYLKQLNEELQVFHNEVQEQKKKKLLSLDEKQHEVNKLQRIIDETARKIQEKKNWYSNLPRFSLKGPSKVTRSLDYIATLGALEIQRESLIIAKETASTALKFAKATGEFFIEHSPYFLQLKAQKELVEAALKLTKKHGEREVFACHALPKREVYGKHLNTVIDAAPKALQPALKTILKPIEDAPNKILTTLYGSASDRGGLFPYPACLLDSGAMTLNNFLTEIRKFLESHPNEVITMLFNDFVGNAVEIAKAFEKSGAIAYVYAQDTTKPWPTLRELIQTNKRLIIFTDDYDGPNDTKIAYPWLNNRKFYTSPWDSHYQFSSSKSFTDTNTPLSHFGKFEYRDTEYPQNKIFEIHHVVTPGLAGSEKEAKIVNQQSVLRPHVLRMCEAADHIVNWISLDFVLQSIGEITDVINHLNGAGKKYAGNPLWKPAEAPQEEAPAEAPGETAFAAAE